MSHTRLCLQLWYSAHSCISSLRTSVAQLASEAQVMPGAMPYVCYHMTKAAAVEHINATPGKGLM